MLIFVIYKCSSKPGPLNTDLPFSWTDLFWMLLSLLIYSQGMDLFLTCIPEIEWMYRIMKIHTSVKQNYSIFLTLWCHSVWY